MADVVLRTPAERVERPALSWGAIIGGWLVATGFAWLFYLLGLAVGFSAFDVADAAATAKGIGIGTVVWVVLTWVASLFLGGMFASWMDARANDTVGTLHGVAVWALAITITAVLGASGIGHLLQGGASLLQGSAAAGAAMTTPGTTVGASDRAINRASGLLAAEINRAAVDAETRAGASSPAPASTSGATGAAPAGEGSAAQADRTRGAARIDRGAASAIALDLLRGKPDDAKARLVAETGLSSADADQVIRSLSSQVDRARADLKAAADKAQQYAAGGLWAMFLSALLGLVAAALGGWVGASHIHRVHSDGMPTVSRSIP